MALTLAEGAKFSNDVLLEGVIETVINDSPVLQRLPFIEIVGNGLTYNRENVAATAAFFAVGDTWTEDTPTFTQVMTTLSILGGDADVDNYLARTRNNVQDLEAAVVTLRYAGSISGTVGGVPVSAAIAAAEMVVGETVGVLLFGDGGNPADALVVGVTAP